MKHIMKIILLSIATLHLNCQAEKEGPKKATQQKKPYTSGSQVYLYYKLPTGRNAYLFFNSDRTGRTHDEHRPILEAATYGNIPEEDAFIDTLSKNTLYVKSGDYKAFIEINPEIVPSLLKQPRPFELAVINGRRLTQLAKQHYQQFGRHPEVDRIPMTLSNVTLHKNNTHRTVPEASLYAEKWMLNIADSGRKLR